MQFSFLQGVHFSFAPCSTNATSVAGTFSRVGFVDPTRGEKSVISVLAASTSRGYSCSPIRKLLSNCVLRGPNLLSSARRRNMQVRYSPAELSLAGFSNFFLRASLAASSSDATSMLDFTKSFAMVNSRCL